MKDTDVDALCQETIMCCNSGSMVSRQSQIGRMITISGAGKLGVIALTTDLCHNSSSGWVSLKVAKWPVEQTLVKCTWRPTRHAAHIKTIRGLALSLAQAVSFNSNCRLISLIPFYVVNSIASR